MCAAVILSSNRVLLLFRHSFFDRKATEGALSNAISGGVRPLGKKQIHKGLKKQIQLSNQVRSEPSRTISSCWSTKAVIEVLEYVNTESLIESLLFAEHKKGSRRFNLTSATMGTAVSSQTEIDLQTDSLLKALDQLVKSMEGHPLVASYTSYLAQIQKDQDLEKFVKRRVRAPIANLRKLVEVVVQIWYRLLRVEDSKYSSSQLTKPLQALADNGLDKKSKGRLQSIVYCTHPAFHVQPPPEQVGPEGRVFFFRAFCQAIRRFYFCALSLDFFFVLSILFSARRANLLAESAAKRFSSAVLLSFFTLLSLHNSCNS
jgi:hypothetical protein